VKAVAVTAGIPGSMRLIDRPDPIPGPGELLVRTLQVGVCGTDRGIAAGRYGTPPPDSEELVIGHEVVGVVAETAHGLSAGTFVAATVRRPCGQCGACAVGAVDACTSGRFTERGIIGLDGFASESFTERPENLIVAPPGLGGLAVLAEPASVAAKGIRQARAVGSRQPWRPERAIVLGVGAIGMLTVLMLALEGIQTWAVARGQASGQRARLAKRLGATYVSTTDTSLDSLASSIGGGDLILEAAGDPSLLLEAIGALAPNGVLCVRGISGASEPVTADVRALNCSLVLSNQALVGCTNAAREDWEAGLHALAAAHERWPGVLEEMIARRVAPDAFARALEPIDAVKTTIEFSNQATAGARS
jgi:threonine dehydrogenase-like Zn-dependent dehydrogenase